MIRIIIALALVANGCIAATRYVSTNGTDSGSASSWGAAWRSLGYAATHAANGDAINVGQGSYGEYVYLQTLTNTTWTGLSNATTCAFRFLGPSNSVTGFRIWGAQDEGFLTWGSYVRVEPSAHWTTISDCSIGNAPVVGGTNFTFVYTGSGTGYISNNAVDFQAAGFKSSGSIFWNGISLTNFWFRNMCNAGTISAVTTHVLFLSSGLVAAETNSSAWTYIYPGSTYLGEYAINLVLSGGQGPMNCTITGNTFTNVPGLLLNINGANHTIAGNEAKTSTFNQFARIQGSGHVISSNYLHDMLLPIHYSESEFATIYHPAGGGFFDFIVSYFQQSGSLTNVTISQNWIENVEANSFSFGYFPDSSGLTIASNVFVGVMAPGGGGVNDMIVANNTWLKSSFNSGERYTMTLGSRGITNISILSNLFLDCGDHSNPGSEGGFTVVSNYGTFTTNGNLIIGPEVSGGIISVRNPSSPRGPDGLPFTSDDGLRPLYCGSLNGSGALPSYSGLSAWFRLSSGTNWGESVGSYSPSWLAAAPFDRPALMRPWTTPPPLGSAPVFGSFRAWDLTSFDKFFFWSFGDGSRTMFTRWPDVGHTFLRTGIVNMTLTVTNKAGTIESVTNSYTIAPETATNKIYFVSTNGNDAASGLSEALALATVTNAMMKVRPGEYIAVLPGLYTNYYVDVTPGSSSGGAADGVSTNPITVVGYGATLDSVSQEKDWWTWEGFEMCGSNYAASAFHIFRILPGHSGIVLRNNYLHDGPYQTTAVAQTSPGGGTNITLINNHFHNIHGGTYGVTHFGTCTNVTMDACIDTYLYGQADLVKWYSANFTVSRQYSSHFGYTNENHNDWLSLGPPATNAPTYNGLIERCWVEAEHDTINALCNDGGTGGSILYSNIVVRNCVFVNFYTGFNPLGMDGRRFYNNLFYHSPWNANGIVSTWGGQAGSANYQEWVNNIFYKCVNDGSNSSAGWYKNGYGSSVNSTGTVALADFNFVTGANFTAKAQAPPDNTQRWGITGQETHGINGGDPSFNNESSYDFRLATNSILRATGTNLSSLGFSSDFFGVSRPASWSIGPFESFSGAASPSSPFSAIFSGATASSLIIQ